VAGGTRAYGVDSVTGIVFCSGQSGTDALVQSDLYLHGIFVGDSHTCGLQLANHTAAEAAAEEQNKRELPLPELKTGSCYCRNKSCIFPELKPPSIARAC